MLLPRIFKPKKKYKAIAKIDTISKHDVKL